MRILYLLLFLSLTVLGQSPREIQVIPNPKTLSDFDHQFKGCLENSECDQVMGMQLSRWKELIEKLNTTEMGGKKKAQVLESFRSKFGIPVEFYTFRKSQQGFKPLLYNSPCKAHNPKQEEQKVYRGTAFIKSLGPEKAIIWRDQAQIELPVKDMLLAQPVEVYRGTSTTRYYLPLGDQPLFIRNQELYVLKEEDGYFYILKVGTSGEWKIVDLDLSRLSEWESKRETVKCPLEKLKDVPEAFQHEFCKTVWDEDLKKTVVVKMFEGCAN